VIERIGKIVQLVRERQGCSLAELASRSETPLVVLTALEQGERGITTTQLSDVARALSLDPLALLDGREVSRPVPSVFLRHKPLQDFDDQDSEVLDEALEQGRSLVNLRALLGEPELETHLSTFERSEAPTDRPEAPAQDGYRLAREFRRRLGDVAGPLGDMRALLEERLGVAVLVRTLQSSHVTVLSVRAEMYAVVVLNAREFHRARHPLLVRVDLAHDLSHVLFDPSAGGLHIVIDAVTDRKNHAAEQRANAFAAELLLPFEGLTQLMGVPRGVNEPGAAKEMVARARSWFGTSHELTANHLCNLRFIDRNLRPWLEAEKSSFTGQLPETSLPEKETPSRRVAEYVERAHRAELLTDGEARALLGMERLAPLPWDEVEL
jgi:Zn-dependent peptidase ImmA (M78 family)